MRRGVLHTTTVRFHADTRATILTESHRLGIAYAEFIRGAVLVHVGHLHAVDRIAAVEARTAALE